MKALVFDIRINSLYSIRIPFTWQSALTYPLPSPSAIIGLLTNALQRYKNNKTPLDYLDEVEENIIWAGAKLLGPAVIKSYTTSAITKWKVKLGDKSTNALVRQFAFTKNIEIISVIKNSSFAEELKEGLKHAPITCGDSESLATIEKIKVISKVKESKSKLELKTEFPVPFNLQKLEILEGVGQLYLINERCKKKSKNFPLVCYLFPIKEKNGILYPTHFVIKPKEQISILELENIGKVVKSL